MQLNLDRFNSAIKLNPSTFIFIYLQRL